MKWKLGLVLTTFVLAIVLSALALSAAYEQVPAAKPPTPSPRTIVAMGSAKVKVAADVAVIHLYVRNSGTLKDNQEKTKKVVDAVEALKIADLRIVHAPIDAQGLYAALVNGVLIGFSRTPPSGASDSVFPGSSSRIEAPPIDPPALEKDSTSSKPAPEIKPAVDAEKAVDEGGYNQNFLVLVTNDNPDQLREQINRVLLTALKSGASSQPEVVNYGGNTSVMRSSVQFYRRDDGEPRRGAMKQAVESALANARVMAASAKITIVETLSIADEGDVESAQGAKMSLFPAPPFTPTNPFEAVGESWLTQRVKIVCTY
jgi:uncharacterized protein YggE